MEYFRSGLKSVLGAPPPDQQITGAETVERLVSRVSTSTLLEDRRDACRALKALSKKYRVEVGAHSMDVLKQVLELDRSDCEIIGYCLDTLCNITSKEPFEDENESTLPVNINIGEQFTEMFIKNTENVALVLSFLEEYDFRVRWPAVKLLTSLLANKPKEIQGIILVSPMGVSKLMDLLSESREVIRNDALLLLINLTKSNANIQKIVAFENAFDRLFEVITSEGLTEGGIVVEDCLILMLNLLKNNTSNINFFNEGSYVQKIYPMLILPANIEEIGWSPQKVSNMHCVLQLIRTLVNPNNPVHIITACQKSIRNANILEALCNVLMASGVPADILTETINTVAEIIRGNLTNQEYFANVMAPSNPPRPAIVVLLLSMVNEKQPFQLRCAVLYCFECFVYKNEIGQGQIIQTLLPSSLGTADVTTGQLLCGGLFSNDSLSNWFSAVSLSHCLIDNPAQKEQLLRVMIATNLGTQAVSLLHQNVTYLQQSNRLQSKIGILMLLSMWLAQCQQAVQIFLNISGFCGQLLNYCCPGSGLRAVVGWNFFLTEVDNPLPESEMERPLKKLATPSSETFGGNSNRRQPLDPNQVNTSSMNIKFSSISSGAMAFLTAQTSASEYDNNEELIQGICAFIMGLCVVFNDNSVQNYSKENLSHLIEKRVGIETYCKKLNEISRHEVYAKAAKQPQVLARHSSDLLLEFEFCKLFKSFEGVIINALGVQRDLHNGISELSLSEHENALLLQYKELIRDQDKKLQDLQKAFTNSQREKDMLKNELEELRQGNSQLNDQNTLLKAQLAANSNSIQTLDNMSSPLVESISAAVPYISKNENDEEKQKLRQDLQETKEELDRLRKDQEDLLELLTDQDCKMNVLKNRLRELGEEVDDDSENGSNSENEL